MLPIMVVFMLRVLRRAYTSRQAAILRDQEIYRLTNELRRKNSEYDRWLNDWTENPRAPAWPCEYEDRRGKFEGDISNLESRIWQANRDFKEVQTALILQQMDLYDLPHLDDKAFWELDYLNTKGVHAFRQAIRVERRARFEPVKDWALLLFGAGGFVVAIMTLLLRMIEIAAAG